MRVASAILAGEELRNLMLKMLPVALAVGAAPWTALGQMSPPAQTAVTINGKKLAISYSAPSVRGRKVFGPGGLISRDPTYPVWRAGANDATTFHTDADLDMGGLRVPKGDYTLWVLPEVSQWKLIINKQTGQWGLEYHQDRDLVRVPMIMSKPPKLIETLKMTLSAAGGDQGKLDMGWENYIASVSFTVK